jgi:quinol monooxygenase YgiN
MHPLAIVWISHLIITHRITIYMKLQVSATMKIRPGMIEGFKNQAAECISQVKHKDPGTLQYDWYINSDNTVCEIRETYENSDALLAHVENLREPLRILFEQFATDHAVVIYGDPSAQLLENAKSRGVSFKTFSFLQGL